MNYKINKLFDEETINKKICEMGKQITNDYKNEDLVCIGILKGAAPFMCELIKRIDKQDDLYMDFMVVSSYGDETTSSGIIRILKDIEDTVEGKNILIIEDVIDTGKTLKHLKEIFSLRKAKSTKIAVLLDKPARREVDIKPDYVGFTIEDRFVVGYGLDYAQRHRNLPYIGEVEFN